MLKGVLAPDTTGNLLIRNWWRTSGYVPAILYMIAVSNFANEKQKAAGVVSNGLFENWLLG